MWRIGTLSESCSECGRGAKHRVLKEGGRAVVILTRRPGGNLQRERREVVKN